MAFKVSRVHLGNLLRVVFTSSERCTHTSSLLAGGYCGFHRGKNRTPSWIFEARAPGYERASAKGGGGKEKPPAGRLAQDKI